MENTHNKRFISKRFGINLLRWLRLAKILIALKLRLKDSEPKGYGWKLRILLGGSGNIFIRGELLLKY